MSMLLSPDLIRARLASYGIANAALFDGGTGYLSRTFGTATDRKIWTLSIWVQRLKTFLSQGLFHADADGTPNGNEAGLFYETSDVLNFYNTSSYQSHTAAKYRDPTGFTHIVLVLDTTQSTSTNRMHIYENGVEITSWSAGPSYVAQNWEGPINNSIQHAIGRYIGSSAIYNGYMANVHFVDGQALDPSYFGEIDLVTGNWKAKKYSGTYGTNGFYLDFSNASNLGEDQSGNGNNWTVVGGVTQVSSTPTNMYSSFDPNNMAMPSKAITANGNRELSFVSGGTEGGAHTLPFDCEDTDGWYAEMVYNGVSSTVPSPGIWSIDYLNTIQIAGKDTSAVYSTILGGNTGSWCKQNSGNKYTNNTATAYGVAMTTNDRGCIAVKNGKVYWGKISGTTITWDNSGDLSAETGYAFSGLTGQVVFGDECYSSNADTTWYTPESDWVATNIPAGLKAVCTNNLPKISDSIGNHFKTVLYTGDGTSSRAITGVGFQPDFVWLRNRTDVSDHTLFDAVRGAGTAKALYSNATYYEGQYGGASGYVSSFDTDGFTVSNGGYTNTIAKNYVAWCASLPNIDTSGGVGTITTTKEIYNATLGMSTVVWTANGSAGTIGHSLGKSPKMVWLKNRTTGGSHWYVGCREFTDWNDVMFLNDAGGVLSGYVNVFNDTAPTDSVVSIGDGVDVAKNGEEIVAYIFAETDFCKIGSYIGNGSTDGPLINAGISPDFLMIKSVGSHYWIAHDSARDPHNPAGNYLFPCYTNAEGYAAHHDWTANGFKHRQSGVATNSSGVKHIYLMIGQPNSPTENTAR